MRALIGIAGLLLIIAWLPGCSQPPEIPKLPRGPEHPVEKIAFDNDFGPDDLRSLFRALNNDSSISALKPYLEAPSDEALSAWTQWFDENVLNKKGVSAFLPLLNDRVEGHGFARWRDWIGRWRSEAPYYQERDVVFSLVQQTDFPNWLTLSAPLLNGDFLAALNHVRPAARLNYQEVGIYPAVAPVSTDEAFTDIKRFLENFALQAEVERDLKLFFKHDFSNAILRTVTDLNAAGSAPFEGFGMGLGQMIRKRPVAPDLEVASANHLDLLLHFAEAANQNANGLFLAIQEQLQSNPLLLSLLQEQFQRRVDTLAINGILSRIRRSDWGRDFWLAVKHDGAKGIPTDNFNALLDAMVTAFEEYIPLLTGPKKEEPEKFSRTLAVYLDAYLITRWFEWRVEKNRAVLGALSPEEFEKKFWEAPLPTPVFPIELVHEDGEGNKTPDVGYMTSSRINRFGGEFSLYVRNKVEPAKNFNYRFEATAAPPKDALYLVLNKCNKVRPYLEVGPLLKVIAAYLSNPNNGSFFLLSNFETDNLMDALNVFIGGTPLKLVRRLKTALFRDVGITALETADRELITSVLTKRPDLKTMVLELLDSVQSIWEFDLSPPAKPGTELPTAFEFYRQLVSKVGASDMHWVSEILSLMGRSDVFAEKEERGTVVPEYPAIYKTIQGRTLPRWLYAMSFLSRAERTTFQNVFDAVLGPTDSGEVGWKSHRLALSELIATQKEGMRLATARLMDKGWDLIPGFDLLSFAERDSLTRWLSNGRHRELVRYFQTHGSRKEAHDAVRTLQRLTTQGDMRRAFQLLTRVQSAPLRKFAGILLTAEANGDWSAFLDFWADLTASP